MAGKPPLTGQASDWRRNKSRQYVNIHTGEVASRRQYEKTFGTLHQQGFTSFEEKRDVRREQGLLKERPGGRRSPYTAADFMPNPRSKSGGYINRITGKTLSAKQYQKRFGPPQPPPTPPPLDYERGMRDVQVWKTSGGITWRAKQFESVDEAAFYIAGFLRRYFSGDGVWVIAYGPQNTETGSDPEADENGEPIQGARVWRTILPFTRISAFNASRARRMVDEAMRLFDEIEIVEVRWRKLGQARGTEARG